MTEPWENKLLITRIERLEKEVKILKTACKAFLELDYESQKLMKECIDDALNAHLEDYIHMEKSVSPEDLEE
jgi:hypothetical protein